MSADLSWSLRAFPIWWRGEPAMCEYVCAQTQQLLLSAALPSERAVTSGWRKAAGCGPEVTGSDPKAVGFDKWAVTIFWVTSETEFFFFFLLTGGVYPGKYSQAVCYWKILRYQYYTCVSWWCAVFSRIHCTNKYYVFSGTTYSYAVFSGVTWRKKKSRMQYFPSYTRNTQKQDFSA